jgi:hypothetical protein
MNTRSAREYTMFAPAQILRNLTWSEAEQPSWPWLECHGGGWKSLFDDGGPASDSIFVPEYETVVELRSKWQAYSLYYQKVEPNISNPTPSFVLKPLFYILICKQIQNERREHFIKTFSEI